MYRLLVLLLLFGCASSRVAVQSFGAEPYAGELPQHLWASSMVKVIWTEPPYYTSLPPGVYAPLQYAFQAQVGNGPWNDVPQPPADQTPPDENWRNTQLLRCETMHYRVGAKYSDKIEWSDPSEWIAWCGNPDMTGDGLVNSFDLGWFKQAYMKTLIGGEWK